jgi:hypothetical protein
MMHWISRQGLGLLVVANTAPVLLAWIAVSRGNWPLDCGLVPGDGRRLFGAYKTWRGFLAGWRIPGLYAASFAATLLVFAGLEARRKPPRDDR